VSLLCRFLPATSTPRSERRANVGLVILVVAIGLLQRLQGSQAGFLVGAGRVGAIEWNKPRPAPLYARESHHEQRLAGANEMVMVLPGERTWISQPFSSSL
jgi:hypothetical protein